MDVDYYPTLVEFLKNTPVPIIYLLGVIYLAKTNKKQSEDNHKELVALIDRYHEGQLEYVKQLTIISEELKSDDREHELPKA